ncbi:MAG: cbb3-type cytochrome c oxidase subunit II [Planctomycetota bacterium]
MKPDVYHSERAFLAVAGGVYLLLVLLVAILPAAALARRYPPDDAAQVWEDPLVARGRELYRMYGCVYCHTQQLRGDDRLAVEEPDGTRRVPLLRPDRRFGLDRPAEARDYRNDDPPFLGTERIGPDLSTVGTRLPSATWHYWHLFSPETVSPDSNMPGLPWLFHTDATRELGDEKVAPFFRLPAPKGRIWATADARALVEYLLSRTRASEDDAP